MFSLTGVADVLGRIDQVVNRLHQGVTAGARAGGEAIAEMSDEFAPHRSGAMHAQVDASGDTARIFYNERYAVYEHEILYYNHPNGGGGKFLERAGRAAPAAEAAAAAVRRAVS